MRSTLKILILIIIIFQACNTNNTDEKNEAIKENKKKFDSSDIRQDAVFAVNAADGGILKIKSGELAQTYGTRPAIKSFGKMMSNDNVQLKKELSLVAWKNNITIPAFLSEGLKKRYTELLKKEGAAFDETYIQFMIQDQQDDLKTFNDEVSNGKNEDIKSWAEKAIKVLQYHLAVCDSISNQMNDQNKKNKFQKSDKLISHSD